jgi:tartrate dehydrogenase/decarboxylase / D-malate dehydrogenase
MRNYKIAAMGGDGIGPEVVEAGVQVLKVCAERNGGFARTSTGVQIITGSMA